MKPRHETIRVTQSEVRRLVDLLDEDKDWAILLELRRLMQTKWIDEEEVE
tara:strand:+ start:104 stop:253 length:150 start_codon:yes stop_codon:yes gene_type:complete